MFLSQSFTALEKILCITALVYIKMRYIYIFNKFEGDRGGFTAFVFSFNDYSEV